MSGQHTQFLDLTNGEGGELPADGGGDAVDHHRHHQPQHHHHQQHPTFREDDPRSEQQQQQQQEQLSDGYDDDSEEEDDGSGMGSPSSAQSRPQSSTRVRISTAGTTGGGGGGGLHVDPSTPGRVVETGREHTGRWTKEEHEAFLSALEMYGKEWKKVAAKVKTRTVVQTRTHAQKYFQKLQKTMEQTGMEDIPHVEMGISSTARTKKSSASEIKRKPGRINSGGMALAPSVAAHAAAATGAIKPNRRSSSTTLSAAQVISGLSTAKGSTLPSAVRHGFSTAPTVAIPPVAAGPGAGYPHQVSDGVFPAPYGGGNTAMGSWLTGRAAGVGGGPSSMKIIAPDPAASMQRGFPEPSPAATGKRKLAEIAAARMLAGVAGTAAPTEAPVPVSLRAAPGGVVGIGAYDGDEGPPTPPPSVQESEEARGLNMKDAPMPPLFSGGGGNATAGVYNSGFGSQASERKGLTLQIVNPETLGVSYEQKKRHRGGGDSPVTPWEGQLKALVDSSGNRKPSAGMPSINHTSGAANGATTPPPSSYAAGTAGSLLPVCGPGTSFGRTPLHKAVCDLDMAEVENMLTAGIGDLERIDDAGYCPLHTACAVCLAHPEMESSIELVGLLLSAGADPSRTDSNGNTPLHWAARVGDKEVAVQLLLKNCPFDAKNKDGETPLHWAMRAGRRGMDVTTVLLDNGSRPGVLSKDFRRPIDVAADGFLDEPNSLVSLRLRDEQGKKVKKELKKAFKDTSTDRKDARTNFLIRSAYSRTLVLHHPECLEHHPKSEHDWETPDRVKAIMRRVLPSSDPTGSTETSGIFPYEITASQEFDRAKLDLLSRVHSTEYLSFVNELSKDLQRQLKESGAPVEDASFGSPPVVPFTPMVQRSMIKIDEPNVKCGMASDTSFSVGSLKAARRAAGAVQHAVDWYVLVPDQFQRWPFFCHL